MIRNLNSLEVLDQIMRDDNNNFSREGSEAIIEYLENLENELDSEIEMDIVKIRTNFTEIKGNPEEVEEEILENYNLDDIEIITIKDEEDYKKVIINDNQYQFNFYKRL
jgi:F0F1-type ATP synthase alpha subunit